MLFQDSQNLDSQGSLDMYTLHEVNNKLLVVASELKKHLLSRLVVLIDILGIFMKP